MTHQCSPFAAALLLAAVLPLQAHAEGLLPQGWSLKLGINRIAPQVDSGNLSAPSLPGTQVDVKADTQPIVSLIVPVADHVTVEAFAGLPYRHDIVGDGAIAGSGNIGSTKQVSPTVFGQYRFGDNASPVRPYLGLGLTYARFYGEEGSGALTAMTSPGGSATRLSIDAAWGLSAQVGVAVTLGERWFLDAALVQTRLKTTTHLSSGQHIDTRLDPRSMAVAVGYRF